MTIRTWKPEAKNTYIAIIIIFTYCVAYGSKKTQVFVVLIKDKLHQTEKEVRLRTNLKSVETQKYHNFLIFSQ